MAQFPEFFVYVTKFDAFITKCTIVLLCCPTVSGTVDTELRTKDFKRIPSFL